MKARLYLFIFLVGALSMMVALQVPAQKQHTAAAPEIQKDLIDTAAAAGNFTTLLKAIDAAGLKETLKGAGPYTLFAPTDEAFAKLPAGAVDALLKDSAKLKNLLLYHMASGTMMSKDIASLKTSKSLAGTDLIITASEGNVMVGNASLVQPDIAATNGIIQGIDTVIMPLPK